MPRFEPSSPFASSGGSKAYETNLSSIVNQVTRVPEMVTKLNGVDMSGLTSQIRVLVTALQPLSEVPKHTISSTLTKIKKILDIFASLTAVVMGAFSAKIQKLATTLKALADEMNKVAAGFSAFRAKSKG